ncbi:galactose ABC transporter substrate-binding protein [Clostridium sp. SHJSY1]|uniref:galactose ABC transporter substrate-binding protein n=1 Tax=Clostridium sp. SHJSY1 TaxID=2942483 RepID=UPI002876F290|nr:galactose ABC transporter substrate-binding protein [Clostridium sp. SHJSY1]MDS0526744.1 galactose ABC transporter substrate-binding protein [Clostridium sp. SHJSY1]
MKLLKKTLAIYIITTIILNIIPGFKHYMALEIDPVDSSRVPVKIALFAKDLTDDYLQYLRKNFEDIQKNNEGKVMFNFYDAKSNEEIQNSEINHKLKEGVDLILLDMVNTNNIKEMIARISQYNVPVIVFNREPLSLDPLKSYKKALYVGTNSKQAGILQGKMISDAWNKHKDVIDKNKDNILQYVILIGEAFNNTALNRAKYSISTIQEAGIKTQELAAPVLNWNTDLARSTVDSLLKRYGNKIEAIISNDDSMAIGAVEALQKYGYNKDDKSKLIPIVGVDLVPEAKELISQGIILGSPSQDPLEMVKAIYATGMNLINNKNPIEGTQYKLDETGVAVRIPFDEYVGTMFN